MRIVQSILEAVKRTVRHCWQLVRSDARFSHPTNPVKPWALRQLLSLKTEDRTLLQEFILQVS